LSIGGEDLSEAFLDRASRIRPKRPGGAPTVEWGIALRKKLVDADFAKLYWVRGATRYVRQNEMPNGSTMALKQFLSSIIFFVAGWLVLGPVLLCGVRPMPTVMLRRTRRSLWPILLRSAA
jgi:hypothetical protein